MKENSLFHQSNQLIFAWTLAVLVCLGFNPPLKQHLGCFKIFSGPGSAIEHPALYPALLYDSDIAHIALDPNPIKRLTRAVVCHQKGVPQSLGE
jgi:hypothetical protein